MRRNFGIGNQADRAEIILSAPRETINWSEYSKVNQEAYCFISMFFIDFYKYVFPSLLCFCISPECVLPSGGINVLVDSFVDFHLNTDNVYKDWELDFLLSLNDAQSNTVANVLKILGERFILEKYWGSYL